MKLIHKKAAKDLKYNGNENTIIDNKDLLAYAFYLTLSQTESTTVVHLFCKFKKRRKTIRPETRVSCGIIKDKGEFMMNLDDVYLFKIDFLRKPHIKMKSIWESNRT